jgi:cytochrome c oxidase subunit 3
MTGAPHVSTIADHGFVPEEHAPDPIIGHGDPTPPGKIGIWLFLASEIMFFIGILGSYVILRAGSHDMFSRMAQVLSKPLAGLNTLILIFSSLSMALAVDASQKGNRQKTVTMLFLTFLCSCGFMVVKSIEYSSKWYHNTIVVSDPSGKVMVYDGEVTEDAVAPAAAAGAGSAAAATTMPTTVASTGGMIHLTGYSAQLVLGKAFDIHFIAPADVQNPDPDTNGLTGAKATEESDFTIDPARVTQRTNYFPWKNMFFACYFTLTGIHGVHVLGGMIPIFILMAQAMRGKLFPRQTEYVGLYWHFVDLVWIFLFPLLYLI